MTRDEVKNILLKISYKPGWRITLLPSNRSLPDMLEIKAIVLNAEDLKTEIVIRQHTTLPELAFLDKNRFLRFLEKAIRNIELHEFYEFFRLDGKCVINPHPND